MHAATKTVPSRSSVHIGPKIAEMCDIPHANFDFDSARLSREAKVAFDALARCVTTGPAAGKGMRIVGHADLRGDEEYNFGLGQRRASSVSSYLEKRGLPSGRMETSSRGELDAEGTHEETWAQDRRVEIFLAE